MELIIKSSTRIRRISPVAEFFETTEVFTRGRKVEVTPSQKAMDMARDMFGSDLQEVSLMKGSKQILNYQKDYENRKNGHQNDHNRKNQGSRTDLGNKGKDILGDSQNNQIVSTQVQRNVGSQPVSGKKQNKKLIKFGYGEGVRPAEKGVQNSQSPAHPAAKR
jgi:hypothetical protein